MNRDYDVAIIGAGWAGLAAAAHLHRLRPELNIALLEQSTQLGGRARGAPFRPSCPLPGDESIFVDNGQHLLMGAYHKTLGLLTQLMAEGESIDQLFDRYPVSLQSSGGFKLSVPERIRKLPSPLPLAVAWLTAQGVSWSDRFRLAYLMVWLKRRRWLAHQDSDDLPRTVQELLIHTRQSHQLITNLWRPLCLSALNTPVEVASAKVFSAVLRDTLGAKTLASDFLVAKTSLANTLPRLVERALATGQQTIITGFSARYLQPLGDGQSPRFNVVSRNGDHLIARRLIVATPWASAQALLATAQVAIPAADPLEQSPIVTIYLYWRSSIAALGGLAEKPSRVRNKPLMLLDNPALHHWGQWLFDLGSTQGGGHLASVVISGPGQHMELERETLIKHVVAQVNQQAGWIPADDGWAIYEKQATFACTAGLQRPKHGTLAPLKDRAANSGVYLCGDYLDSEYPATLETAVRSGLMAAEKAGADLMT